MSECAQMLIDPGIETLSEVLDPIALVKHLRASSVSSTNGLAIEEVQVRVLKHWPGRRVTMEIGWRSGNGWHSVIGKVFRKDRSHIFEAMKEIQQVGFGARDEFSIPQPIAYLPSLRLYLQEKVEGTAAEDIFKTGDEPSRTEAAALCARWLARYHALSPKMGDVCFAKEHLDSKSMRRCASEIAKLGGHLAGKADQLLQLLEDAATSLSPVEMRAGHGGFRASHVILCPGRTVTFDLDTYDVADPARDVARFLAALRNSALSRLGSIRALDGPADVFLKTYRDAGKSEWTKNLPFFDAAACMKRAKQNLRHRGPHWEENMEAMLDEGLRIAEAGTGL